jgi:hypothetical protein
MIRLNRVAALTFALGAVCGAIWSSYFHDRATPAAFAAQQAPEQAAGAESQMAHLQSRLAMVVADYHATNLWFAGRHQNWPLADYYWKEVLSHMELSAALERPDGMQAKLAKTMESIKAAPNMQVAAAIQNRDIQAFQVAYRGLLTGCLNCHQVAGYPFLRPRLPLPPATSIITTDPHAAQR